MPTYKNVSGKELHIDIGTFVQTIASNATISTLYILDHIEGLQRISDEPYYKPVVDSYDLTVDALKEVKVPLEKGVNVIRIRNLGDSVIHVFVNTLQSASFSLYPKEVMTLRNPGIPGVIEKVYLEGQSDVSVIFLRSQL